MALAVTTPDGPFSSGFDSVYLMPDALPELAWQDIDLRTQFLGKWLDCPLLINALTGGTEASARINRTLASMASRFGMGMAVGSMTIALEDPSTIESFAGVREVNRDGVIIANCSAYLNADQVCRLVDMVAADGLQLHFNVAQELAMAEGDRDFRGAVENVARIIDDCPVPVIAKEVGFGFTREAAQKLFQAGIRIIDNGGSGGTNFVAIESQRGGNFDRDMFGWGIPTVASLAEIVSLQLPLQIIATGGVRSALDVAKAIAMGADLAGMTGWFVQRMQPCHDLAQQISSLLYQLKAVFLMCGAHDCASMQTKPLVILGPTAEWLRARGIDPASWSSGRYRALV